MTKTNDKTSIVPPVHPGLALESMRNSSFDTFSAIGELIDNSVEACAQTIKIHIDQHNANEGNRGHPKIRTTQLAVGDDGDGMDAETMHRCLQLGYSSRYNNRQGIGRFGVGMTLGSINQCQHIDVYSRQKGGPWFYAQLDLPQISAAGNSATLAEPVKKTPPKNLVALAGNVSGTIVVWTQIDRMHDNSIEKLKYWLGHTYRKFLSPRILKDRKGAPPMLIENPNPVTIKVNGDGVKPFDPLFALPNIENDPPAVPLDTIFLDFELDDESLDPKIVGTTASVLIRLSLLPKELRPRSGWGGSAEAAARHIPDNLGFSILRNKREVYYGPWIGVLNLGEESEGRLLDRYWGMEIEFPATLDNQFQVRNIKTGARPLQALCERIVKAIIPTILQFRKDIRAYWQEVDHEEKKTQPEAATRHQAAEVIAKTVKSKPVMVNPKEMQRIVEKLVPDIASAGGKKGEKQVSEWFKSLDDETKIIESIKAHPNGPFIDIIHNGGTNVIIYTMKHAFFQFVYQQIAHIETGAKDAKSRSLVEAAQSLKVALDLLIISFAHAHADVLVTDQVHANALLERLISQWSATLSQLTRKLPEQS